MTIAASSFPVLPFDPTTMNGAGQIYLLYKVMNDIQSNLGDDYLS